MRALDAVAGLPWREMAGSLLGAARAAAGRCGSYWRNRPRLRMAVLALLGFLLLGAWGRAFWGVETVRVRRGELLDEVPLRGTLKAVESDRLGPPQVPRVWQYKIGMMVPEGTVVKKGTPVLGFDTSDLVRELDAKRAESDKARTELVKQRAQMAVEREDGTLRLAKAEADLRSVEMKLEVPPDLKSANELEEARLDEAALRDQIRRVKASQSALEAAGEADLTSLEESRERAATRVSEIQDAMGRMTVPSPRDGTVIYLTDWNEQKKKVGDTCWVGEKVLEVADLGRMKAEGLVDEADSGRVAAGQRVRLRLDAHPDTEFTGRIASIWRALEPKSPTDPLKVMKVEVVLDRTDPRRMMPGMRFTGTVEAGREEGAVLIPSSAVLETLDGPVARKRWLFGFRRVRLTIGRRTGRQVEVTKGLRAGDVVADAAIPREAAP